MRNAFVHVRTLRFGRPCISLFQHAVSSDEDLQKHFVRRDAKGERHIYQVY